MRQLVLPTVDSTPKSDLTPVLAQPEQDLAQPEEVNWTVDITQLTARMDGSARIFAVNPKGPESEPFDCPLNKDLPGTYYLELESNYKDRSNVNSALVSAAATAIILNSSVRVGVIEFGDHCKITYMQTPNPALRGKSKDQSKSG